eukprot:PhF_6_TR4838/c0_g1_i1/m.6737
MDTLYTPRGRHYSRNQKRKPDPPLNTPPSLPPPVVLPSSSSPTRGSTPPLVLQPTSPTQSRPTSSLYKCNSLLSVNNYNATGGELNHLVNYGEFVGRNGLWERMRASMGHK